MFRIGSEGIGTYGITNFYSGISFQLNTLLVYYMKAILFLDFSSLVIILKKNKQCKAIVI